MYIDTHTHIYSSDFDYDLHDVIENTLNSNVNKLLLPAIDKSYFNRLISCVEKYPQICIPMIGLHPTSVKQNYKEELKFIEDEIVNRKYIAFGETGLDFYWDDTYIDEQKKSFIFQIELSIKNNLPIVIHSRNSLKEVFEILTKYKDSNLKGVFHCFPGDVNDAFDAIKLGFYIGIGGVVTFKNSIMAKVVKEIPIENILLETDSPYLTPVPFRGQRNDSTKIIVVAQKIAELKNISNTEVEKVTTNNAIKLFNIDEK